MNNQINSFYLSSLPQQSQNMQYQSNQLAMKGVKELCLEVLSLQILDISYSNVSQSGLQTIIEQQKFANLLDLNVSNNQVENIDSLSQFKTLKKLDCSGNSISEVNLKLKSLNYLDLSNNKLTSVPNLTFLESIIVLDLKQNRISQGFENLLACQNLESLYLQRNKIKVDQQQFTVLVGILFQLSKLKSLNLKKNPFTKEQSLQNQYQVILCSSLPSLQFLNGDEIKKEITQLLKEKGISQNQLVQQDIQPEQCSSNIDQDDIQQPKDKEQQYAQGQVLQVIQEEHELDHLNSSDEDKENIQKGKQEQNIAQEIYQEQVLGDQIITNQSSNLKLPNQQQMSENHIPKLQKSQQQKIVQQNGENHTPLQNGMGHQSNQRQDLVSIAQSQDFNQAIDQKTLSKQEIQRNIKKVDKRNQNANNKLLESLNTKLKNDKNDKKEYRRFSLTYDRSQTNEKGKIKTKNN